MSILRNEDWRNCPVIYRRGQQPPSVVIGEIVPKPKPSLDTAALVALGYRESSPNELLRISLTKARRPLRVVEMWYVERGVARHVAGYGATARAAYEDAWRLRRQVARFGSRIAAAQYVRDRIKAQAIPVDLAYEMAG